MIKPDRTSFTEVQFPMVSEKQRELIQEKIIDFFGGENQLNKIKFFSQFSINQKGLLDTIFDPTFIKDSGVEFAQKINRDKQMTAIMQKIYENAIDLANLLRSTLNETEMQLAIVWFHHLIVVLLKI